MGTTSVLELSGVGVPPYSARGLQQSLDPISSAIAMRRTINGTLVDISDELMRKYQSSITGNDQQPPAVDMVWPGTMLTVDCIVELAFALSGTELTDATEGDVTEDSTELAALAGRPIVPGSLRIESGFAFYRPRLEMMVTAFTVNRDEYQAMTSWTLTLEEV